MFTENITKGLCAPAQESQKVLEAKFVYKRTTYSSYVKQAVILCNE